MPRKGKAKKAQTYQEKEKEKALKKCRDVLKECRRLEKKYGNFSLV